ncbi:cytoskeleton protein RodZ [Vibrio sp.]|uniref:cytoskeleton protein RodZ n=1 Tax=Vibrio sp. TaxID=678 RepID=UPI003D0A0A50
MTAEQQTEIETETEQATIEAGTLLKQRREELGLTQRQIADRLRLRLTIIDNIENNQFESDQVAIFTRGYLRSYAKAVGLPEKQVLAALEHRTEVQHREQPMQSFSRKTKVEKHNSRIMTLTWGIFAIIIGISSLWWWQNQQQDSFSFPEESQPAQGEFAEMPSAEAQGADIQTDSGVDASQLSLDQLTPVTEQENSAQESQPTEESVPADETGLDTSSAQDTSVAESVDSTADNRASETVVNQTSSSEAETAAPADDSKLLNMAFSDDCWVQVKDAAGKVLVSGIKQAGQTLALTGEAPFQVILGAPENVSMTFASEPVDLSGYNSGKVARFTLP